MALNEKEEAAPKLALAVCTLLYTRRHPATRRQGTGRGRCNSLPLQLAWHPTRAGRRKGALPPSNVHWEGAQKEQNHNSERKPTSSRSFLHIRIPRGCVTLCGCQILLAGMLAGPANPEVESGTKRQRRPLSNVSVLARCGGFRLLTARWAAEEDGGPCRDAQLT